MAKRVRKSSMDVSKLTVRDFMDMGKTSGEKAFDETNEEFSIVRSQFADGGSMYMLARAGDLMRQKEMLEHDGQLPESEKACKVLTPETCRKVSDAFIKARTGKRTIDTSTDAAKKTYATTTSRIRGVLLNGSQRMETARLAANSVPVCKASPQKTQDFIHRCCAVRTFNKPDDEVIEKVKEARAFGGEAAESGEKEKIKPWQENVQAAYVTGVSFLLALEAVSKVQSAHEYLDSLKHITDCIKVSDGIPTCDSDNAREEVLSMLADWHVDTDGTGYAEKWFNAVAPMLRKVASIKVTDVKAKAEEISAS